MDDDNSTPLLSLPPKSILDRFIIIIAILWHAPYHIYRFIKDGINDENVFFNGYAEHKPFTAGAIIQISNPEQHLPNWRSVPSPVEAEIGAELWNTGLRSIRQLRPMSGITPLTAYPLVLVSFPSEKCSDIRRRSMYAVHVEYSLRYPTPLQAEYSRSTYIPSTSKMLVSITCGPPLSQWLRLSKSNHSLHTTFYGQNVFTYLGTSAYPPHASDTSLSTPTIRPTTPPSNNGTITSQSNLIVPSFLLTVPSN